MFKVFGMQISFRFGDQLENVLSSVGITSERVEKLLGRPCGCAERKKLMNQFGALVERIVGGKPEDAVKHRQHLDDLIKDKEERAKMREEEKTGKKRPKPSSSE